MRITITDVDLLLDALSRGASRHDSLSRAMKPGGHYATRHEHKAGAMLELRERLKRMKAENKPMVLEIG